ncbi:anaerobic benzoate catabolism transcriptional regulator [compost metagenome]
MKRSSIEFDKDLGAQIRSARKAKGLTQSDLASAVGLKFQQIQKYEMGVNRISADMLLRLGRALSVDFSALVAPEGGEPVQAVRSQEEVRLMADFNQLSIGRRRVVLDLLKTLVEVEKGGPSALT